MNSRAGDMINPGKKLTELMRSSTDSFENRPPKKLTWRVLGFARGGTSALNPEGDSQGSGLQQACPAVPPPYVPANTADSALTTHLL